MSTRRAPRKTGAERGPLGAWAYGTRTLIDISVEDAARAAGVTPPTLRKIEGGSNRAPARRVVWDLWQYLDERGTEQRIPVPPPPAPWDGAVSPAAPSSHDDLATALLALAAELREWRLERARLASRVEDLEAQVAELVAAAPSGSGSAAREALGSPAQ
jgi:hypothetical protein